MAKKAKLSEDPTSEEEEEESGDETTDVEEYAAEEVRGWKLLNYQIILSVLW